VSRGIERERQLRRCLEAEGWWTARAAGSLGDADVIALKEGETPRMVEVKSTHRGPFHSFGPADRRDLLDAAKRAGAEAWLAWKPIRAREWEWFDPSRWPPTP